MAEEKKETLKKDIFIRIGSSFILRSSIINISTEQHLDGHYLKVETTDFFHNLISGINRSPAKTSTQTYRVKSQYINEVLDYIHKCLNSDTFHPWNNDWNPDPKSKRTVKRKLTMIQSPDG